MKYFHTQCRFDPNNLGKLTYVSLFSCSKRAESLKVVKWPALHPKLRMSEPHVGTQAPALLLRTLWEIVPTVKELTVKINPLSKSSQQKSKLSGSFLYCCYQGSVSPGLKVPERIVPNTGFCRHTFGLRLWVRLHQAFASFPGLKTSPT